MEGVGRQTDGWSLAILVISLDGDAKKYFIEKNAGDDSAQKLNVPNYSSASTIALFWNK